ncbi:MAG: response regulator transcription factor, partial [Caldilineaceae bacterium]|nr:response regulator transcription factor [Caldilineaceae bacterium]
LRLLQVKLSRAGYTVSRARDGCEAQEVATSEQPHLVLMELLLPDTDGVELLGQLRTATPTPPLTLILSAKTEDAMIAAALTAGAVDYITKPFSPQGVLERIRIALIRASLLTVTDKVQDHYA